jgi:GNAT superfamily N-acetyltransferase
MSVILNTLNMLGQGPASGESKSIWDKEDLTIIHEPTQSKVDIKYDGKHYRNRDDNVGTPQALVTGVETPEEHRGKGGAHAVMSKVADFLDKHGVRGRLNAGSDALQKLYSKHGFKVLDKHRFEMFREPKNQESFLTDNLWMYMPYLNRLKPGDNVQLRDGSSGTIIEVSPDRHTIQVILNGGRTAFCNKKEVVRVAQ